MGSPPQRAQSPSRSESALGRSSRGWYYRCFTQGSNVVVLRPELRKVFPISEAVNDALASYLAFAREARELTARGRKRQVG